MSGLIPLWLMLIKKEKEINDCLDFIFESKEYSFKDSVIDIIKDFTMAIILCVSITLLILIFVYTTHECKYSVCYSWVHDIHDFISKG